MRKIIKENDISGPFTDYLLNKDTRLTDGKKKKCKNKMNPNIKIVDEDSESNIKINNSLSTKNVNLIQDSDDDSVITLPRDKSSSEESTPVKKSSKKIPKMPVINDEEFKYFMNSKKKKPVITKESSDEEEESDDDSVDNFSDDESSDEESVKESKKSKDNISSRDKEKLKQEILIKLLALEKKGVKLTKSYSLKSSLEDLEFEYNNQRHSAEVEASVHFQQKMLMAAVTGVEFLNNKFDPINAKLDGWSESVMDNITDYEEIFAKLHEKYSDKTSMPPELQLLVTLVGSGFMFHLTNSLFKGALPGLGDVLKSNPDIMKNISSAMGQAMNQQHGLTPNSGPSMNSFQPQAQNNMSGPSMNSFVKPQVNNNDISGPSVNLSSMLNEFKSGPPKPMVQQAPKQKVDDSDRFSIASSSDVSEIRNVTVSNVKGKGKKGGRSIQI